MKRRERDGMQAWVDHLREENERLRDELGAAIVLIEAQDVDWEKFVDECLIEKGEP
ncbi:MAG TPA: hypothetical protein VJQ57_09425 [Acidimicrobiia bacterium]|nr:hypothetical protein [Acidimicrobiia bacterium]